MARKHPGDVGELLVRAAEDTRHPKNSAAAAKTPPAERRYIYGGDPQAATPGYAARPANRKASSKKRRSTFNIITALFLSAIGIILYISNILAVNQLAVDVHRLQVQYDKVMNTNSVLKADINRKSSWERIGNAAKEQVGLVYPKERPRALDVDPAKIEEFRNK